MRVFRAFLAFGAGIGVAAPPPVLAQDLTEYNLIAAVNAHGAVVDRTNGDYLKVSARTNLKVNATATDFTEDGSGQAKFSIGASAEAFFAPDRAKARIDGSGAVQASVTDLDNFSGSGAFQGSIYVLDDGLLASEATSWKYTGLALMDVSSVGGEIQVTITLMKGAAPPEAIQDLLGDSVTFVVSSKGGGGQRSPGGIKTTFWQPRLMRELTAQAMRVLPASPTRSAQAKAYAVLAMVSIETMTAVQ